MPATPAHIKGIEARLSKHFGTKVRVVQNKKRGKIMIDFYSVEDFDRISKIFGITKY
jgi:ParB family chromosome partitioning protein